VSEVINWNYSTGESGTEGPWIVEEKSESISDVVTPNYHNLIKQGAIINNSCLYTSSEESSNGVGLGTYNQDAPSTFSYTLAGPLTRKRLPQRSTNLYNDWYNGMGDVAASEDNAKAQAIARIDKSTYAFGEDLLEIRQTLRFLKRPFKSLTDLSRAYRKFFTYKRSRGMSLLDAHAQAWLQYRFAVGPLVRSLHDAVEALSVDDVPFPKRLTARGFEQDEVNFYDPSYDFGINTFSRSLKASQKVKATILYEVNNPRRDWQFKLGLRAKDIPATIWAVMPYSFMVDRVLNVTDFVQAVTNLVDPDISILAGSVSTRTSHLRKIQLMSSEPSGWSAEVLGEQIVRDDFSYNRSPWEPSVLDTIPDLDVRGLVDSATKLADLAALVKSNFRR